MKITTTANVPDGTYFRSGDCEPSIYDDGSIEIMNGSGGRRSWGSPQVTSTVILNNSEFAAIHVGFSHKHRGGQFWRFYSVINGQTTAVQWRSLDDSLRALVLETAKTAAPVWAKVPGKLKVDYSRPSTTVRTAYKIVERRGDELISVYDEVTRYELGKRLAEAAKPGHNGGYYAHPTQALVKELFFDHLLFSEADYQRAMTLALLEVEISGRIIHYPSGKLAATYLRPVRIIESFEYWPV